MVTYFLDTCIFFAFATPFENWHIECLKFLKKKTDEHRTGKRVIDEIDNRWRKRRRLYADLSKSGSGSLDFANVIMNPNDKIHFQELAVQLSKFPKEQILTQLRDIQLIIGKGLEEGKSQITPPLIGLYNDNVCYALQAFVQNPKDAEILTDALCWSEENSPIVFCTLDVHDIIRNHSRIIGVMCNDRLCSVSDIPVTIKHLGEITI